MNEHLFKLKKDGKTVGHLKLADGWTQFQRVGRDDWYYPCDFKWTFAYPFVTKDKNGKDVFAGDRIKGHEEIGIGHHKIIEGEVYLDEKTTFYRVSKVRRIPIYQLCCIELIEEKEND